MSIRILGLVVALVVPILAQTNLTVSVDGRANIYGAGSAVLPAPAGGGGGVAPVLVPLGAAGSGRTLVINSALGTIDCCSGVEPNDADGNTTHGGTNIEPYNSISGIYHANRRMFLVGVFLDDNAPAGTAPAARDFTADFTDLAPELRQVFFLGNGLSQTGVRQVFQVPSGATRLFLGIADAWTFQGLPGYYNDNTGNLNVNLTVGAALFSSSVVKVLAGPDRVFALFANNEIAMYDPRTLLANFPAGLTPARIKETVPQLDTVSAMALRFDRQLLIAGTAHDTLHGKVMFVQAWTPAGYAPPTVPPTQPVPTPWTLLWYWIGNAPVVNVTGVAAGSPSCVYVAGNGPRTVNGVATEQGYLVKLSVTGPVGVLHWGQYIEAAPGTAATTHLSGISAYGGFSNVQAAGWLTVQGVARGFLQIFAENGGTPGPRHVWPEANSTASHVVAVPNRGVFVFGQVIAGLHPFRTNPSHLLRRYTFDGTLTSQSTFTETGATPFRRLAAGMGFDNTGIWTASNLEFTGAPNRIFLRHVGFNLSTILSTRFFDQPNFFVNDLGARGDSVYGGGLNVPGAGFLFRELAP